MSIVSIASIAAFFEGEAKQISRGENAYQSHRVESFLFNSMAAHISAKVGASMKSRVYDVEVSFFPDKIPFAYDRLRSTRINAKFSIHSAL